MKPDAPPEADPRLAHELAHGQFIATTGEQIWNWSSPAGQLRWQRRIQLFTDFLGAEPREVLEVGCGTGLFTQALAQTPHRLTAIDLSPDLLKLAEQRLPPGRVRFSLQNAYATTFADGAFESIVGSSVLHHLEVERALREFFRLLKPGGRLCFTEPNMLNPQIALQKNIPLLKKWAGDSPDETAFFRWRLARQLTRAGFREVTLTPFDFLHPALPRASLRGAVPCCAWMERIPLLREVAGSLIVKAVKPG